MRVCVHLVSSCGVVFILGFKSSFLVLSFVCALLDLVTSVSGFVCVCNSWYCVHGSAVGKLHICYKTLFNIFYDFCGCLG